MIGDISRRTIAKYLGYHGKTPEEATSALIEASLKELSVLTPRHVLRRLPLTLNGDTVHIGGMTVQSKSLAAHLAGCGEAVLMAATLGAQADQMIRKASALHMSRAVVLHACAAAMLEAYLNETGAALARELADERLFLTPRYSPGYGDLPLSCHGEMLAILEAGKRIGLSLTAENLLVPAKSVTAVLGISPQKQSACIQNCMRCPNTACPFREE